MEQILKSLWDLSCYFGEELSHMDFAFFFFLKLNISYDQTVYLPESKS